MEKARPEHMRIAFTLVELLVVIAIIAILAGMLLPALRSAIGSARQIQCANNTKQLAMGFIQYSMDSKGVLPLVNSSEDSGNVRGYWYSNILADRYGLEPDSWTGVEGDGRAVGGIWQCPDAHAATVYDAGSGYGVNQYHLVNYPESWGSWAKGSVRVGALKRPSTTFLIGDTETWSGSASVLSAGGEALQNLVVSCPLCRSWGNVSPPVYVCAPRHSGKTTYANLDGHVTSADFDLLSLNPDDIFLHDNPPF